MLNIYNPNNHDGDKTAELISAKSGSALDGKNGVPNVQTAPVGKISFTKYKDPTQEFTSQELKWSFWYMRYKAVLYKVVLSILFLINAGFVIFNVPRWASYLVGIPEHQRVVQSLTASVNYTGIHAHFAAQPIQVVNTQVFPSRENKYDAVAELTNPNSRFLIWFDYYFVVNGAKTPTQRSFLLPGESRLITNLGLTDGVGGLPMIVLENIKNERIDNRKVADTASWQSYRLNFQLSDFVFSKSLAQEGNNADAVQFKLTNGSPYNYKNVDFYVALLQNGQMVGILPLRLDSIGSLETKNIDIRSFVPNFNITEIAIYPIINVYDDAVYSS
ncbi:MAG: hypothetical protein A2534_02945 [Candidatus Magasanikbacteria bacterium RIFOXYD2_FULL_39_9]|uniref:Uncharacterized protein n=1 Tax=Candidatus Magasanikbacteria bacterium RIFOXYD1_FULL_40_23 TaxID=1798705 RepID=A0A1F6P821_9BACT|nr:MAG: hypothetical protein A2534_02945 [Candidatus Magasanikbacteria bacterium RIFOXYD2_FULL_39_9]OGH92302.1 MAG: hypothetical protein A2563_04945 [Candidatus Magasanikbacteria bacterium RIFOXYD1_FULL_40_23]